MIRSQLRIIIRGTSLSLAMGLLLSTAHGQVRQAPGSIEESAASLEKLALISDLQGLGARAKQLDKPLARGIAEAEVADAAWWIDREMAKELLRDAYALALPEEEEQINLRKRPVGAEPQMPTPHENARSAVRSRVMKIAARDKALAEELARSAMEKLGAYDAHRTYSSLANNAILENDYEAAGKYILEAIDAEPTQLNAPFEINQLASKNRAAADELILAYINRLNSFNLSRGNRGRVILALGLLVRPQIEFWGGTPGTPLPGPAVMQAYVEYLLNTINALERQLPESMAGAHPLLLSTYPLLKQYAPDLTPQFMDLEQRSRKPGESFSLPTKQSLEEDDNSKYEKLVSRELDNDHPDEIVIQRAISHGDFAKARKMIDKLEEGPKKVQLLDMLIAKQAISLANKGDIPGAQKLAENLVRATSILQVFPVIVSKCVANKDDTCAGDAIYQAIRQLKKANVTPVIPPPGIPVSIMPTSTSFDPVVASLGKLASSVLSVNDLAFDVVDELATAANRSELDTGEGYTGFESSLFKKLAEKNELRATAAAMQLKNPLQQIVALAAIDQWKSARFKTNPIPPAKSEAIVKKN